MDRKEIDKAEILRLIKLIDYKKPKLFSEFDIFRVEPTLTMALGVTIALAIALLFSVAIFSLADITSNVIATVALILVLLSFLLKSGEELKVDYNYNKMIKNCGDCIPENERIILRALIKMKGKNPNAKLEDVYSLRPEMFVTDKLLEKLYE
jgi:hypothetical protein